MQAVQNEVGGWDSLSDLEQLECIYSEMYKDVYGVKARWYRAESVEQARKDLDALEAAGIAQMEMEQVARKMAAVNFEKRVKETIALGAGDRATALKWIHDAEGTQGDDEYLCFTLGLGYGYFKK